MQSAHPSMIPRRALIIGGMGGIGLAAAVEFARADYDIDIWDIRGAESEFKVTSLMAGGFNVRCVACDVTDDQQIADLTASHFPPDASLDVLIYSAGFCKVLGMEEATPQDFRDHFETNVLGAALVVKHLLPALNRAGGQVIFLSSVSARVGFPGLSLYCASKAALSGLARGLVPELAARGVRINCVLPTMVETAMMEVELAQRAARGEGSPEELRRQFEAAQPIARFAKPEEIARLLRLIATGELPLMTGAEICYDGGLLATR